MAHKTMIDGVAYEISGGKTLIDGTAYSIKNGKTLVGGTAYEVGFDNGMRKITVTRDYDGRNSGRVLIGGYGGNQYADGGGCYVGGNWGDWTSPETIVVPVGTQIILETEYEDSYTEFFINGVCVYSEWTDWVEYDQYTVTENVTIAMTRDWIGQSRKYIITVTEE